MGVTSAQWLEQLKRHLPRGPLWRVAPGSLLESVLQALADMLARAQLLIETLVVEADPRTCYQLLPEWETSVGLPDDCLPAGGTTQERRNAVVARLISTGGASVPYFTQLAATYGYTITIDFPALHTWRVSTPTTVGITVANCLSSCVDPLRTWGNTQLECLLNRVKPAHTVVEFAYGVT
jgi:uncharacterized protein YmfQ (DUF2313 family)